MSKRLFVAGSLALTFGLSFLPCYADDKDKKAEDDAFAQKLLEIIDKVCAEAEVSGMDRTPWGTMTEGERKEAIDISNRLDTRKVSMNLDGSTFDESIEFLRDITDLNIVVTKNVHDLIDSSPGKLKLRVKDVLLRNALELVLTQTEGTLRYGIRNGVLMIGTVDDWKGKNVVLELIPVEDILYRVPDFPATEMGFDFFGNSKMKMK